MSSGPAPTWMKWVRLFGGLTLLFAALGGLGYIGYSGWKLWQAAHPPAAPATAKLLPGAKAPVPPPKPPPISIDKITPLAGWLMGELVALFLGIRLLQTAEKKTGGSTDTALAQVPEPLLTHPIKPARRVATKRWQSCNVLQIGATARHLWSFGAGKNGFNLNQDTLVPIPQPLPVTVVGRDWKTLFQPKLNIAWLPVDQVFLRVAQLPAGELDETLAMVELQLEKLSPLPVTQIVWSIQLLPHHVDNLQTVIVIMMARDLVEKFLGELEGQGFLADRLELPILDQLLATTVTSDGAYIYPDADTTKFTALVAWWYGGVLRNLGLVHVAATDTRDDVLKEQLTQMAWSGELEGWLSGDPHWHLVADEATASLWQPLFHPWLGKSVDVLPTLSEPHLAAMNANRAARSVPGTGMLPAEYSDRYEQEFHDRLWMRGLGAVLAVYVAWLLIYMAGASWQGWRTQTVADETAGLSRSYTNTLQLKAQLEILQNRQALKFASLDCWRVTAELLPEGITVGTLEFKDGKHYSLSGNAPVEKSTDLTDFNEALRKSVLNGAPMFEDLTIPVVKLNPGGTTVSWSFSGELARAEEVK